MPDESREPDERRHRKPEIRGGLDHYELMAWVCNLLCKGHTSAEIRRIVNRENPEVNLGREEPYQIIAKAGKNKNFRFIATHENALRERIRERCGWLKDANVVHTSVFDDVGYQGARMLVELLQQLAPQRPDGVHVGFAGGHAMRKCVSSLAQILLRQTVEGLPKKVVFHAMAAGFDVTEPWTDPNVYSMFFVKDMHLPFDSGFVSLHAPPVVKNSMFAGLRKMDGIKESYSAKKDLDIIVTSASLWDDPDNLLRKYMDKSPRSMRVLEQAGCVGDMLWRPLGQDGPINAETGIRAMTLFELNELPQFIVDGKLVVLLLGPCVGCGAPKDRMLRVILNARPPLITHLVVDSRTARRALGQG